MTVPELGVAGMCLGLSRVELVDEEAEKNQG